VLADSMEKDAMEKKDAMHPDSMKKGKAHKKDKMQRDAMKKDAMDSQKEPMSKDQDPMHR